MASEWSFPPAGLDVVGRLRVRVPAAVEPIGRLGVVRLGLEQVVEAQPELLCKVADLAVALVDQLAAALGDLTAGEEVAQCPAAAADPRGRLVQLRDHSGLLQPIRRGQAGQARLRRPRPSRRRRRPARPASVPTAVAAAPAAATSRRNVRRVVRRSPAATSATASQCAFSNGVRAIRLPPRPRWTSGRRAPAAPSRPTRAPFVAPGRRGGVRSARAAGPSGTGACAGAPRGARRLAPAAAALEQHRERVDQAGILGRRPEDAGDEGLQRPSGSESSNSSEPRSR